MKAQAKLESRAKQTEGAVVATENSEMRDLAEVEVKSKKTNVNFYDKVFSYLQNRVVIVG